MNTLSIPSIPQQISRRDLDRLRAYRENLDFYNGIQWQGIGRRGERRLIFNYAKTFIDKLASYLMSGVEVVIEPQDTSEESGEQARRAQEALHRVYDVNGLEQLDFETELDASILGDGCYKVTWDPHSQQVRVTSPDVQGIYAWWVGDDPSRVWRIASSYKLSWEEAQMIYDIAIPSTEQLHQQGVTIVEVWSETSFQLWLGSTSSPGGGGSLLQERANPYGFIPFIPFPNLREPKKFWGQSDLALLKEPSRELNRALSQLSMILELSGNPIAVLEGVHEAQDIAVQPGAVWELPEQARAYLLDLLQGGGIKLHIDFIDLVYRALHDLSEAPRTAFGDNPRNLSGVALEMEMHPLLQRVRRKRLIRTAVYKQRNEMILRILEEKTGVRYLPVRQRLMWGQLLPQDRGRLVRDEQILVESGVHSRRRAMEELGVGNPEAEWARIKEEGGIG
ncbi:MAG: phage portal protein [Chloroflexi bacterium]|nr:phage portal protein [Chloroflexota bacterium]